MMVTDRRASFMKFSYSSLIHDSALTIHNLHANMGSAFCTVTPSDARAGFSLPVVWLFNT